MRAGDEDPDTKHMARAIDLARQAIGRTSPNPLVGAVVVRDGRILGRGFHPRAASRMQRFSRSARLARLRVGPPSTSRWGPAAIGGRTGPCTEAIVEAGIARVVLATEDPDPRVNGGGIRTLRERGVNVTVGVLRDTAEALNAAYFKHRRTGLPFVTLKWAISLDGKIASRPGVRTQLTGTAAQRCAHELRNSHDAILVGINTILADDPQLTCRIDG